MLYRFSHVTRELCSAGMALIAAPVAAVDAAGPLGVLLLGGLQCEAATREITNGEPVILFGKVRARLGVV